MEEIQAKVVYVDLDGTLIFGDSLHLSLIQVLRIKPWLLVFIPFWLIKGRVFLKHKLALLSNPEQLPCQKNKPLIAFLAEAKAEGKQIVLATGASKKLATPFAERLFDFDDVLATEKINLISKNKAQAIVQHANGRDFAYIGDHPKKDRAIWQLASEKGMVGTDPNMDWQFQKPTFQWIDFFQLLRSYQWVKNALVFVPILTAHRLQEPSLLVGGLACFFAISFFASAGYIFNDLLDIQADCKHPTKRKRPIPAGKLSLPIAALTIPVLLVAGSLIAQLSPEPPIPLLWAYFVLTVSYSLYFKKKLMMDILLLAGLYTFRIIMGGFAVDLFVSPWLLAFSMFIFLSLAFAKRMAELMNLKEGQTHLENRDYQIEDRDVVVGLGPASGFMAVLVFALYITQPETHLLYRQVNWLWMICPVLVYWISRMWFKARRGDLKSDPVLFAISDPASVCCGITTVAIMFVAT